MKNENSDEEKQKKYLSKINLLERQLQSLRENFENEIVFCKKKIEN